MKLKTLPHFIALQSVGCYIDPVAQTVYTAYKEPGTYAPETGVPLNECTVEWASSLSQIDAEMIREIRSFGESVKRWNDHISGNTLIMKNALTAIVEGIKSKNKDCNIDSILELAEQALQALLKNAKP
jgi:hypothetical protein